MVEGRKPDRSAWWLALVGTAGVVAGALVTGVFNYFDHQRDLDAKMIELSVGILRADPTPETKPLREWAIAVMGVRAKFEFDEAQRAALLNQSLPYVAFNPTGTIISSELQYLTICATGSGKSKEVWSCSGQGAVCGPTKGSCEKGSPGQ